MFNYPYYNFPSYYPASNISRGLLGGRGASSLFKGAASKFSWNGFLTSTGKTLNVINQAIPIFYQVRPIFHNAKTMFKVLSAVKETPTSTRNFNSTKNEIQEEMTTNHSQNTYTGNGAYREDHPISNSETTSDGNPVFFL